MRAFLASMLGRLVMFIVCYAVAFGIVFGVAALASSMDPGPDGCNPWQRGSHEIWADG